MTTEDEDAQTKGGSSPNARRGDPRSAPVIDGTTQEMKDLSPSADPAAKDSLVAAETNESASAVGGKPRSAEASEGARSGEADPKNGGPDARAPTRGNGAIPILALLIALAALAAAGGLGWRVFYAGAEADKALQSQVAALQTRVDALNGEKPAVAALDQRVSALATTAKAAVSAAQAARSDASKALEQASASRTAFEAATRASAAAKASAPPSESASDLAMLDKRVAALEQRPDPRALQTEVAAQGAAADTKLTALGQNLASVDHRVGDLSGKLAAVTGRLNPLEALLKAPKVDAPALEASNAKAVSQAQASALIVVARSLQAAIDSGAPFATEIAAAQKLGADPALLQKLQATAAAGTPTALALRESFEPLAGPILAGVNRKQAAGLLGRLASGLGKLVSVRTIGQSSGDDPMALVGQIEGALAHGDVAAALAACDQLPASDKALTQSWATQAHAHVSANQAARALLKEAMDQLGKART